MDANAGLAIGHFTNGQLTQALERYGNVVKANPDYIDKGKLENDYIWPPNARTKAEELIKKLDSKAQ